jgi:hypothetical protein
MAVFETSRFSRSTVLVVALRSAISHFCDSCAVSWGPKSLHEACFDPEAVVDPALLRSVVAGCVIRDCPLWAFRPGAVEVAGGVQ